MRVEERCFPCLPSITHEQQRARLVKLKTHHDRRRHQCFIPQMESMLTEAESYVQHLSMAIFLAKCCDNCQNNSPRRLRQNKQATIFQHCRHAAIDQRAFMYPTASRFQPQGQRGMRTEQDTSTCFGTKRQTATQEKTLANQRGTFSRGEGGAEQKLWEQSYMFLHFSAKRCLFPLDRV